MGSQFSKEVSGEKPTAPIQLTEEEEQQYELDTEQLVRELNDLLFGRTGFMWCKQGRVGGAEEHGAVVATERGHHADELRSIIHAVYPTMRGTSGIPIYVWPVPEFSTATRKSRRRWRKRG